MVVKVPMICGNRLFNLRIRTAINRRQLKTVNINKKKTMKAGIITFSYACNYGAVLQCLALYRTLRNLGVETDVIRYVPEGFRPYPPVWKGWGIKKGQALQNIPKKWIAARHGAGMQKAFDLFREQHLTFSPACTTDEEIAKVVSGYDALITGSDQVWHFHQKSLFFPYFVASTALFPERLLHFSYAHLCSHAS